jgi:hypothetical protein
MYGILDGIGYLDGEAAAGTITISGSTTSGFGAAGSFHHDGLLDFPTFYNRALSASEIGQLYREPFAMFRRFRPDLWTGAMAAGATLQTICWGHSTGVTQDDTRTFTGNWTGTGSITGSGDGEAVLLDPGEYLESEVFYTSLEKVVLQQNVYAGGDTAVLKYRTAASQGGVSGESWSVYSVPFQSLGYSQIRLEN